MLCVKEVVDTVEGDHLIGLPRQRVAVGFLISLLLNFSFSREELIKHGADERERKRISTSAVVNEPDDPLFGKASTSQLELPFHDDDDDEDQQDGFPSLDVDDDSQDGDDDDEDDQDSEELIDDEEDDELEGEYDSDDIDKGDEDQEDGEWKIRYVPLSSLTHLSYF